MNENNLWKIAFADNKSDRSIINAFLKGSLSKNIEATLSKYLSNIKNPIAIRSSSLLEDSQYQPLAGMYATYMLPNSDKSKSKRLEELKKAIKLVYASTYLKEPKSLIIGSVHRHEEEKMAALHTTAINGSFNLTVNSDPNNDGIVSGNNELIVSVINGSNPFYLTDTGNMTILVMGVTDFENEYPLSGIVVNRGETVDFGGRLVETTDFNCSTCNGAPRIINFTSVGAQFDETWLTENTTDVNGEVGFSYTIPNDQPLGPITITLHYNGTWHMLPDHHQINTVTVRSISWGAGRARIRCGCSTTDGRGRWWGSCRARRR